MSHSIKVSNEVYALILHYQGVRESYSNVVLRAFEGFVVLDKIKRGEWPPQIKEPVGSKEG